MLSVEIQELERAKQAAEGQCRLLLDQQGSTSARADRSIARGHAQRARAFDLQVRRRNARRDQLRAEMRAEEQRRAVS